MYWSWMEEDPEEESWRGGGGGGGGGEGGGIRAVDWYYGLERLNSPPMTPALQGVLK